MVGVVKEGSGARRKPAVDTDRLQKKGSARQVKTEDCNSHTLSTSPVIIFIPVDITITSANDNDHSGSGMEDSEV